MKTDRDEEIIDCFKDHKIEYHEILGTGIGRVEILRHKKPGSSNWWIDYILRAGTLAVMGDLGAAVYNWYDRKISLEWISGCNIGYFHQKCESSELGASYDNYEWDDAAFDRYVCQHFKDNHDYKGYTRYIEADVPTCNKKELEAWLMTSDPAKIFDDPEWYEWVPQLGQVIPVRTRAHLIGLKMAFNKGC